jgi:DNA-binding NarL/FixJ family response regulator
MTPTNILIADDNEMARRRLTELIEHHDGWKVCSAAENGKEAVEKASELKPTLIVLDLAMPVMNGLQAARKIAEIMPTVPILIYTLHNGPSVELEAKKAGARKVVFKPDVDALLKSIEEFLGEASRKAAVGNSSISPTDKAAETSALALESDLAKESSNINEETDITSLN